MGSSLAAFSKDLLFCSFRFIWSILFYFEFIVVVVLTTKSPNTCSAQICKIFDISSLRKAGKLKLEKVVL